MFRFLESPPSAALELSKREVHVGDSLMAACYPTHRAVPVLEHIQQMKPLVRNGSVEQLVTADSNGSTGTLILHGIPSPGGCSGSPLVNDDGEVVGVIVMSTHWFLSSNGNDNRRVLDASNVSFAVSGDALRWILRSKE